MGKKKYFSSILRTYLEKNAITHQSFYVDTPQTNKASKVKNKHLLEMAQALMFQIAVPNQF